MINPQHDQIGDTLDRLLMEGYTPAEILAAAERLARDTQIVTVEPPAASGKSTEPPHFMLPGTHEWPRTPECRCGAVWFRDADACSRQLGETGAQR